MTGAVAAAAATSQKTTRLSGTLSASGAGPVVTSATVTIEMPSPSPRNLTLDTFVDVGIITSTEYNKNAAGWVVFTDGTSVSFAQGDSLAVRANGCTAGESRTFNLTDTYTGRGVQTGIVIQGV